MGMFDYIECEYPLPLPDFTQEELEDLKGIDWSEVEFQTKTFDDLMITYTISEDGLLYENKVKREFVESEEGISIQQTDDGLERLDHTGELIFYGVILGTKWDHWFEFKSLYWKGDLKEIDLEEYKKEDNIERVKAEKVFNDEIKKLETRKKRWWFSFYSFYRKTLTTIFGAVRWSVGLVAKITWKIERWLP
jgi:hypothetical protein